MTFIEMKENSTHLQTLFGRTVMPEVVLTFAELNLVLGQLLHSSVATTSRVFDRLDAPRTGNRGLRDTVF